MKKLIEFINESLNGSYNELHSLAEYLIINCDYKYIVNPILESNFDNVINVNSNNGIDFSCSNDEYQHIGIIYSTVYRKENKISLNPKLLNNGHFNLNKKAKDINYLAYIYENKLCLVDINNVEIKNYSIDISKVNPDKEFDISKNNIDIYNNVYDIYDNLSPDDRNNKQFKNTDYFEELENILK